MHLYDCDHADSTIELTSKVLRVPQYCVGFLPKRLELVELLEGVQGLYIARTQDFVKIVFCRLYG